MQKTKNVREFAKEGDGSYFVDFTDRLEPLDTDVESVVTVDDKPEVLEIVWKKKC